jgi:stress response protein YsnF
MDRGDGAGDVPGIGKLPLTEEQVHIEKRQVTTGKVRVQTMVDVSDELVTQELTAERVAVSRVPVNRYVEVAPQIRTEGELTIIPVLEEVLVVERKLLLKEEIHIQRTVTTELVTETVPVRKQRAVVESEEIGE